MKASVRNVLSAPVLGGLLIGGWIAAGSAMAAELPKATQDMLAKMKLDPATLVGLNDEVENIPAAVLEGAKKEKRVDISGSMDVREFNVMTQSFKERYPFLDVRYSSGDQFSRNVRPLIAYREGRVLVDIVEGLGVNLSDYKQAGALLKLDGIPNAKNVPAEMNDKDGYYVGPRIRHWCMTYNTNKVKVDELPKTWDDVVNMPQLRNGRMGLGNRPNNFMIMLWGAKGPQWSNDFMNKLFNVVKPQLRKEGADALVSLVAAGEMDISFPTASYRTAQSVAKGAPISWWCPTPVPVSSSAMVIMNKSPHPNAAKLYINWFLSKEGQIAQNFADGSPPIHKDLQQPVFLLYPEQTINREAAPRTPQLLEEEMPKVAKLWDTYWLGGAARGPQTVNSGLMAVNNRGAEIKFQGGSDAMETLKVNNSRTKISIDGKEAKRADLKAGMMCKISYGGGAEDEVQEIACKPE
jgi:iron(III) transport system substrate-binding protein